MRTLLHFILSSLVQQVTGANEFGKGFSVLSEPSKSALSRDHEGHLLQMLLKEMVSGPLRDRKVTILLAEHEVTKISFLEETMKVLNEPLILLVLPKDMPSVKITEMENNVTDRNMTKEDHYQFIEGEKDNYFELQKSTVVIVLYSDDVTWWPFWFPLESWEMDSVIFISLSSNCEKKNYFKTPLLEQATFLTVLCPLQGRQNHSPERHFGVWSWKPFALVRQLVYLGIWKNSTFQVWENLFIDRFQVMENKTFTILNFNNDFPFLYSNSEDKLTGLSHMITRELIRWLRTRLVYIDFMEFGFDSYEDFFSALNTGSSDIFINYAPMTRERNREFGLTVPYLREGFGLMLKLPAALPSWRNIIFPFTWPVWAAILLAMLLTSTTYHFLYSNEERSFIDDTTDIMKGLLSHPVARIPRQWRIRYYLFVWWMLAWFLDASYTSNLIAVLTVPTFPKKLESLRDVAASDFRLCMLDYGGFVPDALATSSHPSLHALGGALDLVPLDLSRKDYGDNQCYERILQGTHAHIVGYSFGKYLYNEAGLVDQVYTVREQLYLGYIAFVVRRNTPWKRKLDEGILRLHESGLIEKWHQETLASVHRERLSGMDLLPLSLDHLQGAFYFYLFGHIVSVAVIFKEIFCF